ncbi:O-methyltransferase-domain-containing protein [Apiospora saccharicola]
MELHSKYMLRPWVDIYPTHTVVNEARERPGRPMVVDVGGGKGHDLEKFRLRHHRNRGLDLAEEMPAGTLVLQERPDVVEKLLAETGPRLYDDPAISLQAHDFFTPQTVQGARVYPLHNILHDWADDDAVRVVANIAGAMEKGYSRLLIHESIVGTVRPHRRVTTTDLTMMALFSAKERTEEEFGTLVVKAGLRVREV